MTKPCFAILALISLGCATGENTQPDANLFAFDASGSGGQGTGGSTVIPDAPGGTGFAGSAVANAGTFGDPDPFGNAGTFSNAGTFGNAGATTGGAAGSGSGGAAGTGNGSAGKSTGGAAGSGTGGTGSGGTGVVTAYCQGKTPSPLPFTVNEGFQPSGWQGDMAAISAAIITPDGCAARSANPVGACSAWRYTPNAAAPAWAGVSWSKVWDAKFTHPPVCLAAGATKVTFQARGAAGGEQVIFSAAGAAELPFTLTNAWKEYSIPLTGVEYNSVDDGLDSGFFWKVAPPTPAGAPVTFFVDDIQFVK